LDWIEKNFKEAVDMCVDYSEEEGNSMNHATAEFYLKVDTYFSPQEAMDMMTTKAQGKNYSDMEGRLVDVLQFFIDTGSRQRGDVEKFVGHVDTSVFGELLKEIKKYHPLQKFNPLLVRRSL
jgi:hypothetical protein